MALARYADSLNQPDQEGLQRLMRLLNIQVVMTPGRVLVTGLLDPSLFTIGRTLACPLNWRYTVVIRPKHGQWPRKRRNSRRHNEKDSK